jgi:3-hydroxyisobutyrate dehydrogenase-like beta-hydroxyacid dehydrogenase
MVTVAIVSPGFMGAGLGWALRAGGARVVATVEGRSARTRRLAAEAGLDLLPGLADVVAAADVVLSVVPPGQARETARSLAAAAREAGRLTGSGPDAAAGGRPPAADLPLVAELNAVSPVTMAAIERDLAGLPLVDGAISGAPPTARPGARLFLSGPRAAEIGDLPWADKIKPVVIGGDVGSASALKMCTASVYKGLNGLVTQAMRVAGRHGVLPELLADLAVNGLDRSAGVATAATKAHRFVDEMREIAATQADAGLTPDLFLAYAAVYADVAGTPLAAGDPESTGGTLTPEQIVRRLG